MRKTIFYLKWTYYKLNQYYKLRILNLFIRDVRKRMVLKFIRFSRRKIPEKINNLKVFSKIYPKSLYRTERKIYSQNCED